MFNRFDIIAERNRQTQGRTESRQTDRHPTKADSLCCT